MGTWFIGNKISKLRCVPFSLSLQRTCIFAAGSWDGEQESNKISFWKVVEDMQGKREPKLSKEVAAKSSLTDLIFFSPPLSSLQTSLFLVSTFANGSAICYRVTIKGEEVTDVKEYDIWKLSSQPVTCVDSGLRYDKNVIACGSEEGSLHIMPFSEMNGRDHTQTVQADVNSVRAVKFVSSNEIITASTSNQLKIWDMRELKRPVHIMKEETSGVFINSVSPHPSRPDYLATGSSSGCVSIWDKRKATPLSRTQGHTMDVWEVLFHREQPNYLFSCSDDGSVLLWDFNPSKDISKNMDFTAPHISNLLNSSSAVSTIDFHSQSNTLIAAADNESLILKSDVM